MVVALITFTSQCSHNASTKATSCGPSHGFHVTPRVPEITRESMRIEHRRRKLTSARRDQFKEGARTDNLQFRSKTAEFGSRRTLIARKVQQVVVARHKILRPARER